MSIVRVGLSEKSSAAEGYDAIFGKKKAAKKTPTAKAKSDGKKKKARKK
jgi:hypothetical protein